MTQLLTVPRMTVLMVLFSYMSFAAVVFTPAYPELAREFHLSDTESQWMMTIFLLATTFGRLPYGPLANRYGRKKTIFLGLLISLLGTIVILCAHSYPIVCVGRFIQALGAASGLKLAYTMIGDVYKGAETTKVLSYASLIYAILPGIGTAVSGFLVSSYGWKGGFWFFFYFTIALLFACFCLPETLKQKDFHALEIRKIATGYGRQFKNRSLVLWSLLMGLSTAVLFIFSQQAPFVAIDLMGITAAQYGVFYLVPALGIALGSFLTAYLAGRVRSNKGMLIGIGTILVGALTMGGLFLGQWISGWALFLPQVVIQLGDALLYTNASSKGLSEAEDKSNASAIMLFINSWGSVVGPFAVGILAPRSLMAMPISFLIITVLMLAIWFKLRHHRQKESLKFLP